MVNKIKKSKSGLTLVEIIIFIAILGLLILTFLPLFTMSTKTNNKSQTTLDSTYVGRDTMEAIYNMIDIEKNNFEDFEDLVVNIDDKIRAIKIKEANIYKKYEEKTKKAKNIYSYKYKDKKYIKNQFKEEGNLIRVIIRVYGDEDMNELETQYESLYFWKESVR